MLRLPGRRRVRRHYRGRDSVVATPGFGGGKGACACPRRSCGSQDGLGRATATIATSRVRETTQGRLVLTPRARCRRAGGFALCHFPPRPDDAAAAKGTGRTPPLPLQLLPTGDTHHFAHMLPTEARGEAGGDPVPEPSRKRRTCPRPPLTDHELGQVTHPLWASVSTSVQWGQYDLP